MIPSQLQNAVFRFVLLRPKEKKPFELGWQDQANYRFDDPKLLAHIQGGANYGCLAGRGGLIVLDCDQPNERNNLTQEDADQFLKMVRDKLPKTLTVKTGTGGFHFYLQTDDLKKIVLTIGEKHFGELQGNGSQVVGPGSIHPNGYKYTVENDCELAYVSRAQLKEALKDYWPEEKQEPWSFHGTTNDLDDQLRITDVIPTSKLYKRTGDELQGEHPIHGSDTGSNFTVNTSKNVAYCFRHERGGGPLYWLAVMEGIINCGDDLRGDDFKKTLAIAKEKHGYIQPIRLEHKFDMRGVVL